MASPLHPDIIVPPPHPPQTFVVLCVCILGLFPPNLWDDPAGLRQEVPYPRALGVCEGPCSLPGPPGPLTTMV